LPHIEGRGRGLLVLLRRGLAAAVRGLDQLLSAYTLEVALDAEQDAALLGVRLLLAALAAALAEVRALRVHLVEPRAPCPRDAAAEHVERLEIELRGVDAHVLVRVVERDVAERDRRLLPVLGLEVGPAARVLGLDVLLVRLFVARRRLDVADVPVEG